MTKKLRPCVECSARGNDPHQSWCQRGRRLSRAARKGAQNRGTETTDNRSVGTDEVLFIVDRSGSMAGCWSGVAECLQQQANALIDNREGRQVNFSLIDFDSTIQNHKVVHSTNDRPNIGAIFNNFAIRPRALTSLLDAIGTGIEYTRNRPVRDDNTAFIIVVITDGYENASTEYNKHHLANLIKKVKRTDNYTFAFSVPNRQGIRYLTDLGIDHGDIQVWENSLEGIQEVMVSNTIGLSNYTTQRSLGATSVQSFYADLGNVNHTQVAAMRDYSTSFKRFRVTREQQIRDFVERQGYSYRKGNAFYQLVKPELVQETKNLMVMDKQTGSIYGGREARDLLNLPHNERFRLRPGDHGEYEIFVESTSVNRKVRPNSAVLYRVN